MVDVQRPAQERSKGFSCKSSHREGSGELIAGREREDSPNDFGADPEKQCLFDQPPITEAFDYPLGISVVMVLTPQHVPEDTEQRPDSPSGAPTGIALSPRYGSAAPWLAEEPPA
jgi:hypothetical protein